MFLLFFFFVKIYSYVQIIFQYNELFLEKYTLSHNELIVNGSGVKAEIWRKYKSKILTSVVRSAIVDAQKRISIGNIYEGVNELTIVGAKDSIHLMSQDEFNEQHNVEFDENEVTLKLG